jgi:uncharacterized SAM-binding protein YcdF (DUF218 family)
LKILIYIPSYGVGSDGQNVLNFDTMGNLEKAYKFWSSKFLISTKTSVYFAVVGGIFLPEEYQTIPISTTMMNQLIAWKIPPEKIFSEEKSVDSWENVKFINYKIKKTFPNGLKDFDKIYIVSHKCHIRHKIIMRSYGIKKCKIEMVNTDYDFLKADEKKDLMRYIKEFISNCISIVDPKGCWFPILLHERKKRRRGDGKLTYKT